MVTILSIAIEVAPAQLQWVLLHGLRTFHISYSAFCIVLIRSPVIMVTAIIARLQPYPQPTHPSSSSSLGTRYTGYSSPTFTGSTFHTAKELSASGSNLTNACAALR